jgi:hypothetical protein
MTKGGGGRVLVGNDGHFLYCSVDHRGDMTLLLSFPAVSLTGISKVWSLSTISDHIIVGGYYGNHFAVVDVVSGYEFFCVNMGGRQRIVDVGGHGLDATTFPYSWVIAACINQPDGWNDIKIHGLGPHECNNNMVDTRRVQNSVGIPLHGESIFDIHLFPVDASCHSVSILTGSEACFIETPGRYSWWPLHGSYR